jgi:hypothetical protein
MIWSIMSGAGNLDFNVRDARGVCQRALIAAFHGTGVTKMAISGRIVPEMTTLTQPAQAEAKSWNPAISE